MSKESVTLPPGDYIIGDPYYLREHKPYLKEHEPYTYFYTGGDGAFYDNFDNCYFVDSARIAVFAVSRKPRSLPEGIHHFAFKNNWTIVFDTHDLSEEIKITPTPFRELGSKRL